MPGFMDVLANLASGIGQAGLNIGSAFALRELMPNVSGAGWGFPGDYGGGGMAYPYTNPYQRGILPVQQASLGLPFVDVLPQGSAGIMEPFTPMGRPKLHVMMSPTGRVTWFRPAGRPMLWSSDFTGARRVRKLAARARRRVGGR